MKASKFTEAQKAFMLKQGEEGTPVAEICRKAGISQATYFNWKKRYCCATPEPPLPQSRAGYHAATPLAAYDRLGPEGRLIAVRHMSVGFPQLTGRPVLPCRQTASRLRARKTQGSANFSVMG